MTTLTIVDTPGIIANMDSDENHAYVGQFKKIVRKEIEGTVSEFHFWIIHFTSKLRHERNCISNLQIVNLILVANNIIRT